MIKFLTLQLPSITLPTFFFFLGPLIYYKKRLQLTQAQYLSFHSLSLSAGAFSDIGPRPTNEDQHVITTTNNFFIAAVFDGHCGAAASKFAAEELQTNFDHFPTPDEIFKKFADINDFVKENTVSGCTACAVFIENERFLAANVGDSRCVLLSAGQGASVTVDHKPNRVSEKARIMQGGGVVKSVNLGVTRMFPGGLSVSRALGDREIGLVSGVPEVFQGEISVENTAFVVACDGLWDIFSTNEVANFVNKNMPDAQIKAINHVKSLSSAENVFFRGLSQVMLELYGKVKSFLSRKSDDFELNAEQIMHSDAIAGQILAQKLVESALLRNSQDNVSVIIVLIRHESTPKSVKQWKMSKNEVRGVHESEKQGFKVIHDSSDQSAEFYCLENEQ